MLIPCLFSGVGDKPCRAADRSLPVNGVSRGGLWFRQSSVRDGGHPLQSQVYDSSPVPVSDDSVRVWLHHAAPAARPGLQWVRRIRVVVRASLWRLPLHSQGVYLRDCQLQTV